MLANRYRVKGPYIKKNHKNILQDKKSCGVDPIHSDFHGIIISLSSLLFLYGLV